jgi:hypothetical protein
MPKQDHVWPSLPLAEWRDTYATLHMWTQIVGKIRLAQSPLVNHWWNVPLYLDARGLTTSLMPLRSGGFEMRFDFLAHELVIESTEGGRRAVALAPRSVADFHRELMSVLASLGIDVRIWTTPVEVESPIPFEQDTLHRSYDPEYVERLFDILVQAQRVLEAFRGRFVGKCSPVHFFWGSFDLAVSRFSGRLAPPHPPAPNVAPSIMREAYSHEVCSAGFWPGGSALEEPIFYSYAYPEPPGAASAELAPSEAHFDELLREYVLPYEAMRAAASPDAALTAFLESTYDASAELGRWDRAALERVPPQRARPQRRVQRARPRAGAE